MQQPIAMVVKMLPSNQAAPISDFSQLKDGDRLNWLNTSRGGYAHLNSSAALFKKAGAKRIQIQVMQKGLYEKQWTPVLKWVDKESLTHRTLPSSAFNEVMVLDVEGFKLTAYKHPAGNTTVFRNGIFYGEIDGYSVTAPVGDAENALVQALYALENGGYRTALKTALECYEGWLKQNLEDKDHQKAREKIADVTSRLAKLDCWEKYSSV
jgi:hypothetical protein